MYRAGFTRALETSLGFVFRNVASSGKLTTILSTEQYVLILCPPGYNGGLPFVLLDQNLELLSQHSQRLMHARAKIAIAILVRLDLLCPG